MKFVLALSFLSLLTATNSNAINPLTVMACEKEGEIKALWDRYQCQDKHESTSCQEVKKIRAQANFEMGVSIRSTCAKGRFSRDKTTRDKANTAYKNGSNKIASN